MRSGALARTEVWDIDRWGDIELSTTNHGSDTDKLRCCTASIAKAIATSLKGAGIAPGRADVDIPGGWISISCLFKLFQV
jgi:hypothetical protein